MDVEYEIIREKMGELAIFETEGVAPHMHHQVEVIVVAAGAVHVTEGGTTRRLTEGQAAIADSYTPHAYKKEPDSLGLVVIMPKDYLADYRAVMRGKTFLSPFMSEEGGRRVLKLVELLKDEPGDSLAARGLVNAVLGEFTRFLTRTQRVTDPTLVMRDVLIYLSDNFTEPVTLTALSRRFGYAPTHFSRVFNAYTGANLNEYLGSLRAEHAAGLLKSGQSVTDAAMNAGFSSIRTFYRAFRRKYGVCPKDM